MHKILLVEDDHSLGSSLQSFLKSEGYDVTWVQTIDAATKHDKDDTNLIILDWMLPDGQGIDLLKELRHNNIKTPIIMLTARSELLDKVLGLESGANDYLTKPFEPRELLARIRVQTRTGNSQQKTDTTDIVTNGDVAMNLSTREVTSKKQLIELTKMEFDLLRLFLESPQKAFSREEILNTVWGYDSYPTTRTVDMHVLQLRQKIGTEKIETIRGIGYRFIGDKID